MKAKRIYTFALMAVGLLALAAGEAAPRLVWNRTASLPTGLYVLTPGGALTRGTIVAYQPSPQEAEFLAQRGYTGRAWPLIKRVAALEGDEVCRTAQDVRVNGAQAARAQTHDAGVPALPTWSGCQRLGKADILLLADHPRSIDGRYFGVQDRRRVHGVLHPVWTPGSPTGSGTIADPE